jgi:hypothetical protein
LFVGGGVSPGVLTDCLIGLFSPLKIVAAAIERIFQLLHDGICFPQIVWICGLKHSIY